MTARNKRCVVVRWGSGFLKRLKSSLDDYLCKHHLLESNIRFDAINTQEVSSVFHKEAFKLVFYIYFINKYIVYEINTMYFIFIL